MPSTCEFLLDNPYAVYNSGDTVSGTIVLNTTKAKEIRDMRIIFRGEGKVSWTETESHRNSNGKTESRSVHFKANELYVDNNTVVAGEGTLPAGTHTYSFQILLPLPCPTSLEGRHGHIRYELSIKLDRPLRIDNEFSKPLTVIKREDLNLNPVYRFPVAGEDIHNTCCWPCSGGKIHSTLSIPFGGYAIGQTVKFSVHVQNESTTDIESFTANFKRRMIFTAHRPHHKTRMDKTVMDTKSYESSCLRLTNRILEGSFVIPSTAPSTTGTNIIDVSYYLKVTLHTSGCTSDCDISVPIFIGTVPLRESLMPPMPPPQVEATESDRFINAAPSAPDMPQDEANGSDKPPNYQGLAPPSFEEATRCSTPFADTDKQEHQRHIGFRPLYPMYSQSDD